MPQEILRKAQEKADQDAAAAQRRIRRIIVGVVVVALLAGSANAIALAIFVTRASEARQENCNDTAEAFDTFSEILVDVFIQAGDVADEERVERIESYGDYLQEQVREELGDCH